MSVADFSGKFLLVNFWASWCVPCREEMPALDAIATEFNSDRFMVLPINLDIGESGLEKAQDFSTKGNSPICRFTPTTPLPLLNGSSAEAVAIGLPATLLLDPEGCELAVLQGPAEWHSADGKAVVEALIGLRG